MTFLPLIPEDATPAETAAFNLKLAIGAYRTASQRTDPYLRALYEEAGRAAVRRALAAWRA